MVNLSSGPQDSASRQVVNGYPKLLEAIRPEELVQRAVASILK